MNSFDYRSATLEEFETALGSGAARPEDFLDLFHATVGALDSAGPTLRTVLSVDPRTAEDAATSGMPAADPDRGPSLRGVPILVKDNIDTAGPLGTTAGSLCFDTPPTADAPLVRRLRSAGGVIAGKANLSEWGNFRASRSTRGWSAVGGLTRNPYGLDRSAGGSSSGSAAAVAAGIVPLAIGTETDASILCPASLNGVVGIKPTVGLVPAGGIVPISRNQDTAGPFARRVRDAARCLDAMAEGGGSSRYEDACVADGLAGMRIGVVEMRAWQPHPKVQLVFEQTLRAIASAGAALVEDVVIPGSVELAENDYELTVLLYDFKAHLNAYLATRAGGGNPRCLTDVIRFNRAHADDELRHFGQDLLEAADDTGGTDEAPYRHALATARRLGGVEGIDAALASADLDCLVVPAFGPAWKTDLINGDGPDLRRIASPLQPIAVAGYPGLSVPTGMVDGLPVGVVLMGGAWSEETLIRAAYGIERAVGPCPAPTFAAAT